MFQRHFYNESIRNVVVAFGSLFNKINIEKKNADGSQRALIQVPLSYSNQEKFLRRLRYDARLDDDDNPNVEITLPRLSFNMSSINYDGSRKRATISRRYNVDPQGTQTKLARQYAEVPYNFGFELGIYAANFDDGLQIVEQILPYFTPEFTVTLKEEGGTADIYSKVDIPIVLESVDTDYDFLGDYDTRRILIWNLNFTAKANLYGPTKTSGVITKSTATIFNWDDVLSIDEVGTTSGDGSCTGPTGAMARIDVVPNPTGAMPDGSHASPTADPPYTYSTHIYEFGISGGSGPIGTRGCTI